MPGYGDVPQRLFDGEAVPVSEIIAYAAPMTNLEVKSCLAWMELCGVIYFTFDDETKQVRISTMGYALRRDLIRRFDGECPEDE